MAEYTRLTASPAGFLRSSPVRESSEFISEHAGSRVGLEKLRQLLVLAEGFSQGQALRLGVVGKQADADGNDVEFSHGTVLMLRFYSMGRL